MKKLLPKITPKGFTLVELMIAISIIAILAAIGFTVYSNTQINARDTKRKQDIDAIATAIEGRKVAGDELYQPVTGADFSGGAVPTDPKVATQVYCLLTYGLTAGATPIPPPPVVTYANFTGAKTTCTNNVTPAPAVSTTMATALPASTTVSWTVCAYLEGVADIYCRKSN